MRKTAFMLFASLSLISAPLMTAPLPAMAKAFPNGDAPASFADLAEKLLPAVVNISSTQKAVAVEDFPEMPHFPPGSPFEDFFDEFMDRRGEGAPMVPPSSLGSGFIIDAKNGYVVTNFHVIKDADEVRITLHDDTTLEAEIIGRDEKTDLALLKVTTDHPLTAVPFGNSDDMRVGDWVVAIGNPFGLGGTVTAGIVSARQRDIQSGPYDDYIQTDASINRGNSGGPMFNLEGEVIGINTAIFSPSGGSVGIGFAIPSSLAAPVIKQLIEYGKTRRGWLGVRIQNVTDEIAESLGLDHAGGALIASVTPTGPAEKAGLQAGDIILDFDGKPIDSMRTLPRAVAETPIGKKADITIWRNGKKQSASVEIGELEKAEETGLIASGPENEDEPGAATTGTVIKSVGMTINKITPTDRDTFQIPKDVEGLLISKIEPMSEAAEKGLMPGDVIVEVNQKPVSKAEEISDIMAKAEKAGRTSVLLLVNRQGDVRFVALKLGKK